MTAKLLGAALIGGAAVWALAAKRRQLSRRKTRTQSLLRALEHMETAIRWQRMAMIPLLAQLSQWPDCGAYFANILQGVKSNIPLQESWKKEFSTLPDRDAADVLQAVELTGDEAHLQAALQYAQHCLRRLAEQREREDIREQRLTGAMLLSAAGMLVILLI